MSKCRGDWDLGLCTFWVFAKRELLRNGNFQKKKYFARGKNRIVGFLALPTALKFPPTFFRKRSFFDQTQQPLNNVKPFERILRAFFFAQCPYKFSSFLDLRNGSCRFRLFACDFRRFRFSFLGSACCSKVAPPRNLPSRVKYYWKYESFGKEFRWTKLNAVERVVVVVVVSLSIQLNPRAQNVSRPWREPHRRFKSVLRSTKLESPHRTIEAPRMPRSWGGGRTNAVFMPPRTIKILGPRGPRRVHANAHIDTRRGNQSFRITRPDYWRGETTRHR